MLGSRPRSLFSDPSLPSRSHRLLHHFPSINPTKHLPNHADSALFPHFLHLRLLSSTFTAILKLMKYRISPTLVTKICSILIQDLFWQRWTSPARVWGLCRLKLRNWRNFVNSGGCRSWLGCVKSFPHISNVCLFGCGLGKKMLIIFLFIVCGYGRMTLPLG